MVYILKVFYFKFKNVNSLKYHCPIVIEKNYISKEVASRIQAGNRTYYRLAKLLSSKLVSKEINRCLHTKLIRPVILHVLKT